MFRLRNHWLSNCEGKVSIRIDFEGKMDTKEEVHALFGFIEWKTNRMSLFSTHPEINLIYNGHKLHK